MVARIGECRKEKMKFMTADEKIPSYQQDCVIENELLSSGGGPGDFVFVHIKNPDPHIREPGFIDYIRNLHSYEIDCLLSTGYN